MGKLNTVLHHYFSDERRFADLFNGILFQGECAIKPGELEEASEIYAEKETDQSVTGKKAERLERIRDIKKKLSTGGTLRLLALENQNLVDYVMPLRRGNRRGYICYVRHTGNLGKPR